MMAPFDPRDLLAYEETIRSARNLRELLHLVVDETPRLLRIANAFLLRRDRRGRWRIDAATGVSAVEPDAPAVRELEAAFAPPARDVALEGRQAHIVSLDDREGRPLARLALVSARPLGAEARSLVERLRGVWVQALLSFGCRAARPRRTRLVAWTVPIVAAAALAWPVPLVALAPYEIVAREPVIVAAPLDGAVAAVHVADNARVAPGAVLAELESGELRAAAQVAERRLDLAEARLRAARQARFGGEGDNDVDEAAAEARVARAERDRARHRLSRAVIRAPREGVALHGGRAAWRGRPVRAGERILELADPRAVEARLELAVSDAVVLAEGARVRLFPDADPTDVRGGEVSRVSYLPRATPDGRLIYPLAARVEGTPRTGAPRIGARGIARLSGPDVPLALWLLRRPVAWTRRFVGW